jgi:hypothetical protein
VCSGHNDLMARSQDSVSGAQELNGVMIVCTGHTDLMTRSQDSAYGAQGLDGS